MKCEFHASIIYHLVILIANADLIATTLNTDLLDVLSSYDTLHHSQLNHHRSKRSLDNSEVTEVKVDTLGRNFHLMLQNTKDIFAPGFQVLSVDRYGKEKVVEHLDVSVYKGKLNDDDESEVEAYFEEDEGGINLVATIHTKGDVYVIEPSWRHLPASSNYTMISYKGSDMKMKDRLGPSYCGFVHPDGDEAAYSNRDERDSHLHEDPTERYRRQAANPYTPVKNTCSLLLVADYRFYSTMGQNSLSKTTTYLISLIHRVNQIYRKTTFGSYIGMGLGIKAIRVHEEWSVVKGNELNYNMERDTWPTKLLLEVFSRQEGHSNFCLSHLFTSRHFADSSLGLSYVASPVPYNPGGICSPAYHKDGHRLYLNTGWSSSLNRYNRRLLTQEADLVTTHEFGHNWGSEHDPDTEACSPNSFSGGKHIMYTYSVSGYDPNNDVFSVCSQRSIGAVLQAKSFKCFTAQMRAFCGNALVESGEECDPGPQSVGVDGDTCCTKDCKLRSGYECSDHNDECCTSCMFSPRDVICHQGQNQSCEDTAKCNGASKTCPTPPPKHNGSPCVGRGKCQDGVCQPYCESKKKLSCACDSIADSCKWCCRDDSNSTCKPDEDDNGQTSNLLNGMPCVQGYCDKGVCEKQVQDLVQRFWDIIEQLGPNTIVAFMKANIVGTVIILSLFIWIPASCIVWRIDKRREQEEIDKVDWLRSSNNTLVHPNDRHRIHAATRVQPRRRDLMRDPIVRPGASAAAYLPPAYHKPYQPNPRQPTTMV